MTEIVIKIHDSYYEGIKKAPSIADISGVIIVNVIQAIKNGTVLPKGHGGLVDAYQVDKAFKEQKRCEIPCLVSSDEYFKEEHANEMGGSK